MKRKSYIDFNEANCFLSFILYFVLVLLRKGLENVPIVFDKWRSARQFYLQSNQWW